MRAKGEPDADFPRAHAHGVGNDAVEPEARERQRDESKQHRDFRRQSHRAQLRIGVILALPDLGDGHNGIDLLDRFACTASAIESQIAGDEAP